MSMCTSNLHSSQWDLKDWSAASTGGAEDAMVAEGVRDSLVSEHLWTMPWNYAAMMLDRGWPRWRRQRGHSCWHIRFSPPRANASNAASKASPDAMPVWAPYVIQAIPFNFKKHCFFARKIPNNCPVAKRTHCACFCSFIQRLCERRSIWSTWNIIMMIFFVTLIKLGREGFLLSCCPCFLFWKLWGTVALVLGLGPQRRYGQGS